MTNFHLVYALNNFLTYTFQMDLVFILYSEVSHTYSLFVQISSLPGERDLKLLICGSVYDHVLTSYFSSTLAQVH